MEGRQYLRLLRRNWQLMLLAVVVALVAAAGLYAVATPTYEATMTFAVQSSVQSNDPSAVYQGQLLAQSRTQTYRHLFDAPGLTGRLADATGLSTTRVRNDISATADDQSVLLDITVDDESSSVVERLTGAITQQFPAYVARIEPSDQGRLTTPVLAAPPATPEQTAPSRARYGALGLLAGVLLAVALAAVREGRNGRVRDIDDVRSVLGAEVAVTHVRKRDHADVLVPLAGVIAAASAHARPLAVVPLRPGPGAAAAALGLGRRLHDAGGEVLLVDADADGAWLSAVAERAPDVHLQTTEQSIVVAGRGRTQVHVLPSVALAGIAAGSGPGRPTPVGGDTDTWAAAVVKVAADARDAGSLALVVTDGVLLRTRPRLFGTESVEVIVLVDAARSAKAELAEVARVLEQLGSPVGAVVVMSEREWRRS